MIGHAWFVMSFISSLTWQTGGGCTRAVSIVTVILFPVVYLVTQRVAQSRVDTV